MEQWNIWELKISQWIQAYFRCDFLDWLMPRITLLGNAGWVWIFFAAIALFFRKSRRCGVMMGICLLTGLIIGNLCLKNWLCRPRPCWLDPSVSLLIAIPRDFSFPSGHSLSSFTAAGAVFAWNRKKGSLCLVLAALISFSRIYLYVHFVGDVVCGAVLGLAIAWVWNFIFDKAAEKRRPNQSAQNSDSTDENMRKILKR